MVESLIARALLRHNHVSTVGLNRSAHLVEAGDKGLEFDVSGVVILTSWNLCQLIFDDSVHFSHGVKDSTVELVLVIDLEPSVENGHDVGFEDLSVGQLLELLVSHDSEL